jgi:hypothetical protein
MPFSNVPQPPFTGVIGTDDQINIKRSNGILFNELGGVPIGSILALASTLPNFSPELGVSAGASAGSFSALTFSNSNGVSFGISNGVVTGTVQSTGLASEWNPPAFGSSIVSNSSLGQNSIYFAPFDIEEPLNAFRLNLFASVGTSSGQASNSTWGVGFTGSAALYQRDVGTNSTQATSFWSGSFFFSAQGSSNSNMTMTVPIGILNSTAMQTTTGQSSSYLASSVGGFRAIPMPMSLTLFPGRYILAFANSSSTSNLANTLALTFMQQTFGQLQFRPLGTSSAASNASFFDPNGGFGTFSATSNAFPGSVALNSNSILAATAATRIMFNFSGYTTGTNFL